jgi:nitroreductase
MTLLEVEMSLYQAILARRSVRSYTTKKLEKETISSLLEAAIRAPTATHGEPWGFVVIQDQQLLKSLSDKVKPTLLMMVHHQHQKLLKLSELLANQDVNIFYNARTLIMICGNTKLNFYEADCWLAAENLILASTAMCLGSCIIGCALPVLKLVEVKIKLGIPNKFTVVAPIVIDYPSDIKSSTSRRRPLILSSIPKGITN